VHSDEYEIAISREIKVCESMIKRIKTTLSLLEQKHGRSTEDFLRDYRSGKIPVIEEFALDYRVWNETSESLQRWLDLEQQYRKQFRIMKI
jgi:hypothetical protein